MLTDGNEGYDHTQSLFAEAPEVVPPERIDLWEVEPPERIDSRDSRKYRCPHYQVESDCICFTRPVVLNPIMSLHRCPDCDHDVNLQPLG